MRKSQKTIGDEVNWESIIENINDDLIIVSRDNAYINNQLFLANEFNMITGKQLVRVTKKITDALVLVGGEPTAKLLEIEEKQIEAEEKVRWISFPAGGSMGTYSPQPITISADQATFGRIEYPVTSISIMNPSGYIGEPVLSRCPHCGAPYYGGEKCDSCQRKLN